MWWDDIDSLAVLEKLTVLLYNKVQYNVYMLQREGWLFLFYFGMLICMKVVVQPKPVFTFDVDMIETEYNFWVLDDFDDVHVQYM